MADTLYDEFIRARITELRLKKKASERGMSLELGKSDSYIRGITSGAALPSLRELFNICAYFEMSICEFFAPMQSDGTPYDRLCARLRELDEADLEKINTFIDLIGK